MAESCDQRLRKGSAVLIEGELQTRNWKSEDGSQRSVLEVKARRIQFLNKAGSLNGRQDGQHEDHGNGSYNDDEMFELFEPEKEPLFSFDIDGVGEYASKD